MELDVIHGQASDAEAIRKDVGVLQWARVVKNKFFRIGGVDLIWQPIFFTRELGTAELVVIMQENRILSNYPLLFFRRGRRKVGFWGHGANFQSRNPDGIRERWKRYLIGKVDWWFGYTETTVRILRDAGYPMDRITCINNAVDTSLFRRRIAELSESDRTAVRSHYGVAESSMVGIFCGSLYSDKRLDLLLAASAKIKSAIPQFVLLVIGDGPCAKIVRDASSEFDWVRTLGVISGEEKFKLFAIASFVLNPGAVGLHILDAFAAGLPLISTFQAHHGPEIAYIDNDINALLVEANADAYASAVISLANDATKYESICSAASESADRYTLDNAVGNFADGLLRCLEIEPRD